MKLTKISCPNCGYTIEALGKAVLIACGKCKGIKRKKKKS